MTRGSIIFKSLHPDDYQLTIELSDDDTVWMTIQEIAKLYNVKQSVLETNLKALLKSAKLLEECVKIERAYGLSNDESCFVEYFNLEVIIALSFRIESYPTTLFRQWVAQQIAASIKENNLILSRLGTTAMMN